MKNVWLQIRKFPVGTTVKVVDQTYFYGSIGVVVGYEPGIEELIEVEFVEVVDINGKKYRNFRVFIPPDCLIIL